MSSLPKMKIDNGTEFPVQFKFEMQGDTLHIAISDGPAKPKQGPRYVGGPLDGDPVDADRYAISEGTHRCGIGHDWYIYERNSDGNFYQVNREAEMQSFREDLRKAGFAVADTVRHGILRISNRVLARLLGLPEGARILDASSGPYFTRDETGLRLAWDGFPETKPGEDFPDWPPIITNDEFSVRLHWNMVGSETVVVKPDAKKLAALLLDAALELDEDLDEELIARLEKAAAEIDPRGQDTREAVMRNGNNPADCVQLVAAAEEVASHEQHEQHNLRDAICESFGVPKHLFDASGKADPTLAAKPMGHYRSLLPEEVRNRPKPSPRRTWDEFEQEAGLQESLTGNVYLWCPAINPPEVHVLESAKVIRDGDTFRIAMDSNWCRGAVIQASEVVVSAAGEKSHWEGESQEKPDKAVDEIARLNQAVFAWGREYAAAVTTEAAAEPAVLTCRGCGKTLFEHNFTTTADGCPCNNPRGINHGLVPKDTCTCVECDPAQTGSVRQKKESWRDRPPLL